MDIQQMLADARKAIETDDIDGLFEAVETFQASSIHAIQNAGVTVEQVNVNK